MGPLLGVLSKSDGMRTVHAKGAFQAGAKHACAAMFAGLGADTLLHHGRNQAIVIRLRVERARRESSRVSLRQQRLVDLMGAR
jgi:hypothetical protein